MKDLRIGELKNERAKFIKRYLFVLLLIAGMTILPSLSFAVEATLTDDAYTYSGSKTTKYGDTSHSFSQRCGWRSSVEKEFPQV